jgi:hypothetical protein
MKLSLKVSLNGISFYEFQIISAKINQCSFINIYFPQ